jgi:predicted nucleotidyltransferase
MENEYDVQIKEILGKLEVDNNIDIIYAVEAGSRAWGFESVDSDFDIRFIYKQKDIRKYLSLNEPVETIDGFSHDRKYDWQGWDLRKALKLLRQLNPSLIEWLYTPIVYYTDGKFAPSALELVESRKQVRPLLYHYRSMAKSNYMKHIDKQTDVPAKKYLYVIRPASMVIWLLNANRSKYMEINFDLVLNELSDTIGSECFEKIKEIIKVKKLKSELDTCTRIECIDKVLGEIVFDKNEFKVTEDYNKTEKNEDYDCIFLKYFGF